MPFRLLNKEVSKHHKLNGATHKCKSLNINNHCGRSFKINTRNGYCPLAFYPFCPEVVISSLPCSEVVVNSLHCPKAVTMSISHLTTSTPLWWHLHDQPPWLIQRKQQPSAGFEMYFL